MPARKLFAWLLLGICLASIAVFPWGTSHAEGQEPSIGEQLKQAERILIATPEKVIDVVAGDEFLVVIDRVLRGKGQKGKLVRIVQNGDAGKHTLYEAKQPYIFLLKDNKGAEGWINLGLTAMPLKDGKIGLAFDGKKADEISLDEFQELIATKPAATPEPPARTSLEGRWIVTVSQSGSDLSIWLVDVTRDKEVFQVRLLSTTKAIAATTLKTFSVSAEAANLVFDSDGQKFDFQGRLDQGTVRGSIALGQRGVLPARLVATSATALKGEGDQASAGREEFKAIIAKDDTFDGLQKFVNKFPDSPLTIDACRELINQAKKQALKQPQVQELADQYLKTAQRWGARIELKALIDVGVTLARNEYLPELAMKYLAAAEAKFTPETIGVWKLPVLTEKAKLLISTGKAAEGGAILETLHAANPLDADTTYTLAKHAEKSKQAEKALALYAEIAVLPMMQRMLQQQWSRDDNKESPEHELPTNAVKRLWKEQHGDTDGLNAYLNELYEQKILAFPHDKADARPAGGGTRVVLCELFTGAQCPPCVGADVATAALEATYPRSEVIVVRYHQHIPGPDPLANEDSQHRFSYYQGEGTPTLVRDGKKVENAGGFLMQAEPLYKQLREEIDPALREKDALSIDLSAEVKDGVLALLAKAAGQEKFPDDVRLRLILAEDKVEFAAGNGIRFHEMTVRSMPGGPDGVAPKDGKLQFSERIDLAKLKSSLEKYLGQVEKDMSTEFEDKPLAFKALHLVALLQDDGTQEVLQAASIPVTGTLPADTKEEGAEKPQAKPKGDASQDQKSKPAQGSDKAKSPKPAETPQKPKAEKAKADEKSPRPGQ